MPLSWINATNTAISLVGSEGAAVDNNSGSSLSPLFGQSTTAGDLLVGWVCGNSSGATNPFSTTASGWTVATCVGGPYSWIAIFYKPNCGAGETAPVFNLGGSTDGAAQVAEFSNAATASPVDSTATSCSGSSTATSSNVAADSVAGDLIVAGAYWNGTNAGGTVSTVLTDSNGVNVTAVSTQGSPFTGVYFCFAYGVTTETGSSTTDTVTMALSTYSGSTSIIASFKP